MKKILTFLLCLMIFAGFTMPAYAAEPTQWDTNGEQNVIDADELQGLIDGFMEEFNLTDKKFSVGYCYTETGDTWFYNEDKWYYSASLYKVPLMMIYAQMVHNGELEQTDSIRGMELNMLEEYVLVNSSNDYGHLAMDNLGGDRDSRVLYQQFSTLDKDAYDSDFLDYSYFSARFMTDVMMNLYYEQDSFPNIIDCLLRARPESHFNATVGQQYDVAQKYGSYEEYNHNAGVVYAEKPYILVVMTKNVSNYLEVIAKCARLIDDYTLGLNERLASEAVAEQERLAQEQEQQAAAERERLEQEKLQQQAEQEAQNQPDTETQPPAEEEIEAPADKTKLKQILITATLTVAVLVALIALIALLKRRRQTKKNTKRQNPSNKGKYTPRH